MLMEPMILSGLLIDCQLRHWKLICSQMQKFPSAHIDQSQDIIKEIIDKHIPFTDSPPHAKGHMWAVEYLQRVKVQLQNMTFRSRDDICAQLMKAMHQAVTSLSELVAAAAEVAILTFVSLRERTWSLYCGEGEIDLAIEYCEIQHSISKIVILPTLELQQGLYSLFGSVLQEIASARTISTSLRSSKRIFPKGGIMHQYGIIATQQCVLRPDLELAREQRRKVNAAELHRVPAVPDPFLMLALQDNIRKRQLELELLMHEYSSIEKRRVKDYSASEVLSCDQGQ